MDDVDAPRPTPPDLLAMLERSRADAAAGRTVPIDEFLARLDTTLTRVRAASTRKAAAPAKA